MPAQITEEGLGPRGAPAGRLGPLVEELQSQVNELLAELRRQGPLLGSERSTSTAGARGRASAASSSSSPATCRACRPSRDRSGDIDPNGVYTGSIQLGSTAALRHRGIVRRLGEPLIPLDDLGPSTSAAPIGSFDERRSRRRRRRRRSHAAVERRGPPGACRRAAGARAELARLLRRRRLRRSPRPPLPCLRASPPWPCASPRVSPCPARLPQAPSVTKEHPCRPSRPPAPTRRRTRSPAAVAMGRDVDASVAGLDPHRRRRAVHAAGLLRRVARGARRPSRSRTSCPAASAACSSPCSAPTSWARRRCATTAVASIGSSAWWTSCTRRCCPAPTHPDRPRPTATAATARCRGSARRVVAVAGGELFHRVGCRAGAGKEHRGADAGRGAASAASSRARRASPCRRAHRS